MIPAGALPYKTALGLNYDCGDFAANQEEALALADLGRVSGAARRGAAARQIARHRHRQPDREGRGARPGIRRDPLSPERQRDAPDGQQEPGPGPRDDVQAGAGRKARARPRRRPIHRRRHRPRRLRHRHQRLALDGDRRLGVVDGGRQDHRQGQEASPPTCWRRPKPTSSSPTRQFLRRRHRPAPSA